MNRNGKPAVNKGTWEDLDLPGQPVIRLSGEPDRELPVKNLITDTNGDVILLEGSEAQAYHAADALTEHFKRDFQTVHFCHPDYPVDDIFGFALASSRKNRPLTLPERAAVAAICGYCAKYLPSLKIKEPIVLPRILLD